MIGREEAFRLVNASFGDNVPMLRHVLAVEAVMRALADKLGEDASVWGVTGLIHDLDYPRTLNEPELHAKLTCEELQDRLPEDALRAILVHAGHAEPSSNIDWGLYCSDPVTGLITAGVYMHPSRCIAEYSVKSLLKRYKDRRFAAGANRDQIASCGRLGIELPEFFEIAIAAMNEISGQLGL